MASLWDKYDSDTTYDEYLGEDNKLRKQAKIISNILGLGDITDNFQEILYKG